MIATYSLECFSPRRSTLSRTGERETEALRDEVKELRERLARLAGLLGQMAARAENVAARSALPAGEAQFLNASLPDLRSERVASRLEPRIGQLPNNRARLRCLCSVDFIRLPPVAGFAGTGQRSFDPASRAQRGLRVANPANPLGDS